MRRRWAHARARLRVFKIGHPVLHWLLVEVPVGCAFLVTAVPLALCLIVAVCVLAWRLSELVLPPVLCGLLNVQGCRAEWLVAVSRWWNQ